MTEAQVVERLAKAIYWGAYDQYCGPEYRHPLGFDRETAWSLASDQQRSLCRHQAVLAMQEIAAVK